MLYPTSPSRLPGLIFWVSIGVVLLWGVGEVFGDRNWWLGLLFYLPSPVIGVWATLATIWLAIAGCPKRAAAVLILSALPWSATFWLDGRWPESLWQSTLSALEGRAPQDASPTARDEVIREKTEPASLPPYYRACHWNILSGKRGWTPAMTELRSLHADLYLLSETPRGRNAKFIAKDFGAGHFVLRFNRQTAVSRYPLENLEWLVDTSDVEIARFDWEVPTQTLSVFMVDMASSLTFVRGPALENLVTLIRQLQPDLIMGDLNAPRRSLALRTLPEPYRHAHDVVGEGLGYTWPEPVPFLAIDHCIFGDQIAPRDYWLQDSRHSDHRRQVFDFRVRHPKLKPASPKPRSK